MTTPYAAKCSAETTFGDEACLGPGELGPQLEETIEMLRELSRQTDPQKLVEVFRHRSANLSGGQYLLSLSRRDLEAPWYRITRHADWPESFNPWQRQAELPLLREGLLGELIYGDRPRILHGVSVSPDDPGRKYLRGARSLLCLPQYDGGVALNMVVRMSREPYSFDESKLPDTLVVSNLFGRATYGLVLAKRLEEANAELDHELKSVGRVQRSLLPKSLPAIGGLEIAVSYATATRAGGDYYDFFPLARGRWGVIIADVSGHGAPAAVVMAIVRTILHTRRIDGLGASAVLRLLNRGLSDHGGSDEATFVTAFYAVYDPAQRVMRYSCAGHVPPMLIDRHHCWRDLDDVQALPLGVRRGADFHEACASLAPGDTVVLYTDGIVEAAGVQGEAFGTQRMRAAVCQEFASARQLVDSLNGEVVRFVRGATRLDDQTLLVIRAK